MNQEHQKALPTEPTRPAEKPVLSDAIDVTIRAIEDRARCYRNLVVAMSAVLVLSVFSAVFFGQWMAFAGLALLAPLTGGFLFLDSRRVRRWRAEILGRMFTRELEVAIFRKTISVLRSLPAGSLQAMLSTLPSGENADQRQTRAHNAAGDEFDSLRRKHEWRILGATGLLTLTLLCFAGAIGYRSFAPLPYAAGCVILLVVLRRG